MYVVVVVVVVVDDIVVCLGMSFYIYKKMSIFAVYQIFAEKNEVIPKFWIETKNCLDIKKTIY